MIKPNDKKKKVPKGIKLNTGAPKHPLATVEEILCIHIISENSYFHRCERSET